MLYAPMLLILFDYASIIVYYCLLLFIIVTLYCLMFTVFCLLPYFFDWMLPSNNHRPQIVATQS